MADTLIEPKIAQSFPLASEVRATLSLAERPLAISSRQADFATMDTGILTALPRLLMENLAMATDIRVEAQQVLKWFGEDRARVIDHLVLLLQNPDMVDIVTRLPPRVDIRDIVPIAEDWRRFWLSHYDNPDIVLSPSIDTHADRIGYLQAVLPFRVGQEEEARKLYELIFFFPQEAAALYDIQRYSLTAMNKPAIQMLRNAAETALNLAGEDSNLQQQVISAIRKTIEAQDKWWVLGADQIDSLTKQLLELLAKRHLPQAAPLILDALYRKAQQDETSVATCLFPPDELPLEWEAYGQVIDTYINLAIEGETGQAIETERSLARRVSPPEIKRYLASRFGEGGVSSVITELIISRRQLHEDVVHLGRERETEYFGKRFKLLGLPDEEDISLRELSFGICAAQNGKGEFFGLFQIDPSLYPGVNSIISVGAVPPENLLYWSSQARKPIPKEKLEKFLSAYPELMTKLSPHVSKDLSLTVLPLASFYQLWDYLEAQPPEKRKEFELFLKEYGSSGIFSFLLGEYGPENIPFVIRFATEAYQPREYVDKEGIDHLRLYHIFSERLLKSYALLCYQAWDYASLIGESPQRAVAVRDLILQRAKAMLVAAAKLHHQQGSLSGEGEVAIQMCFDFYKVYLHALSFPNDRRLQQLGIPANLVRSFLRFHDPTDPDIASLYHSVEELAFQSWASRQKAYAPYYGRMGETNRFFYCEYKELEKESGKTTSDPEAEIVRDCGILDRCFEVGIFSPEKQPQGIKALSLCCGSGERIDAYIIAHLKAKGYPLASYKGIELLTKAEPPAGMEIIQNDVLEELQKPQHKNAYRLVLMIWPGVPGPDAFELDKLEESIRLTAESLEEGGIAIIDLPLPYGKHSIAPLIAQYQERHQAEARASGREPFEPPGLYTLAFQRPGGSLVGKQFLGLDPEEEAALWERYNCWPLNLPSDWETRDRIYTAIDQDDSILERWQDAFAHFCWQTNAPWNRYTLVLYKGTLPPEIRAKLPQPRDISVIARGQS